MLGSERPHMVGIDLLTLDCFTVSTRSSLELFTRLVLLVQGQVALEKPGATRAIRVSFQTAICLTPIAENRALSLRSERQNFCQGRFRGQHRARLPIVGVLAACTAWGTRRSLLVVLNIALQLDLSVYVVLPVLYRSVGVGRKGEPVSIS